MSGVLSRTDLARVEPEVARKLFRTGAYFMGSTSGMCQGHVQTNLLGLDKTLAEDFAKFCAANSGPLPLLFKSEVGQFTALGITPTDSDIRTDLPAYNVMQSGKVTDTVENLLAFPAALENSVFFYLGCSFSFDVRLQAAGVPLRNQEQNCAVSQFKTGIKCHPIGPFQCQLVVSLRPIPRHLVETAFKVTQPMNDYHGAPVHIGDPALIGISDVGRPEYCGPMKFLEGDVPVFWACGTTVMEAMKEIKPSFAFTHYEKDSVYISDALISSPDGPLADIKIVTLCEKPYWASVTSEAIVDKIKQLEGFIGTGHLGNSVVPDDLLKSVLALSHASSVAVTAGFRGTPNDKNLSDDHGVPGALAVAIMLQALGKKVDLVVDKMLYGPLTDVLEALVEQKVLARPVSVVQFPPQGEQGTLETAKNFLLRAGSIAPHFDHLLGYRSAQATDEGGRLADGIGSLFLAAADLPTVHTSSIQDGNNELGMGKVREAVHRDIAGGPTVACAVASDFLLTAGVSNWGGYAVAVGLYLVSCCPVHERYRRRAVGFPPSEEDRQRFRRALPDVDRESQLFHILCSHKFFNTTGMAESYYDGVPPKITKLLSVTGEG